MGQRTGTESVVAIVGAFLRERVWSQAALARELGLGVRALRARLLELQAGGIPLEREEERPHVYWSVPKGWLPGGVHFQGNEVLLLLRQLARAPRSRERDALLQRVLAAAPARGLASRGTEAIVAPAASEVEEMHLPTIEESSVRRQALRLNYYTASRGVLEWRHVSVQRVIPSPPARFVAVCHRDGALKWFRLDNVAAACVDPAVAYRVAEAEAVQRFHDTSLDGFHEGATMRCAFVVREPEARWVRLNLPGPAAIESVPGGIRVVLETGGGLRLARYLVGLGAAVRVETASLRALVLELAREALEAAGEGEARGEAAE
jgi:predicted DNA-binding transcriptional regulator YafY